MKKYLYLLVIGFLFTNYNYGQSKQDSIESYKKVNKWAVVKLTIAYMEDLKGWPKKNNNSNKNDEEKTYDALKTKYNLYSENVNLEEVYNLLSKGWSITRDRVFQEYKKELVGDDTVYGFNDICFVPEKVNNKSRLETIAALSKEYNSLLPKPEKQNEIVIVKNDSPKPNLKPIYTIKADNSFFKYIIQYLPLAIAILIILFLSNKLRKVNKKIEGLKRGKTTKPKGLEVDNKRASQNELKLSQNAIKSLNAKVVSLQKENSNLIDQLNLTKNDLVSRDSEKPQEDIKSTPIDLTIPKEKQTSIKLIYFPSPFEESRFANEDVSETEKPFSLYVAEIDKNTNRGNISLLETADLSRALNSPNTFLETVCNYENAYYSAAKAIKVIEDGQVALIGDDWVVSSKIKIKFI